MLKQSLVAFLLAASCSGASGPPAPANGYQLATGSYTVPAGSEQYLCFAHTLTEKTDVAITEFQVYPSQFVHHLAVFRTLEKEPEGMSVCPVLIKTTWIPMFAGGRGTSGLTLPAGAGFQLAANDQVLVQLHLLNATSQSSEGQTFVNMTYAPRGSQVT